MKTKPAGKVKRKTEEGKRLRNELIEQTSLFVETGFNNSPEQKAKYISIINELFKHEDYVTNQIIISLMGISRDRLSLLTIEKSVVKKINSNIVYLFGRFLTTKFPMKEILPHSRKIKEIMEFINTIDRMTGSIITDNDKAELLKRKNILSIEDLNEYFQVRLKILDFPLVTMGELKKEKLKRKYLSHAIYTPEHFEYTNELLFEGYKQYVAFDKTLDHFGLEYKPDSYRISYKEYENLKK